MKISKQDLLEVCKKCKENIIVYRKELYKDQILYEMNKFRLFRKKYNREKAIKIVDKNEYINLYAQKCIALANKYINNYDYLDDYIEFAFDSEIVIIINWSKNND